MFAELEGQYTPPYLILSHRWGTDEVSYKDFRKGRAKETAGYRKVLDLCSFARSRNFRRLQPYETSEKHEISHKYEWVWIDTCCIDKRSSAELSEAINSMYRWYADAEECVVRLSDVPSLAEGEEKVRSAFWRSGWSHRGWTLQELLAPSLVIFCTDSWEVFGHKSGITSLPGGEHAAHGVRFALGPTPPVLEYGPALNAEISDITRIQPAYLSCLQEVREASIARRMSWAADRRTTRVEDQAYCLLGLFNITMPLLYGEQDEAFRRLQEELVKRSCDQSIFVWQSEYDLDHGMFARSADQSKNIGDVIPSAHTVPCPYFVSNRGAELDSSARKVVISGPWRDYDNYVITLNCKYSPERQSGLYSADRCAIVLVRIGDRYWRVRPSVSTAVSQGDVKSTSRVETPVMHFIVEAWKTSYRGIIS